MTHFILTRHGHVDGIHPPRFRGRREIPLSPLGRRQASALATRISRRWKIKAVYTSPMQRCLDTGAFVADACGVIAKWFTAPQQVRFPQGESLQELVARAADAIRTISSRHAADTVVLVGHASINRAILLQILDQPLSAYWRLEQSPCAINEFVVAEDRIKIDRINDTTHLEAI